MSSATSAIDAHRWRQVRQVFLDVSTLDAAARDAYLRGVDDTAIDAAVRRLLSLHDELTGSGEGFAAVPVAGALAAAFERAEQAQDSAIAEFRIERIIGEGGMGRVYLASREVGGATQRVALKIVPFAVHGPRVVEQLRRERAILAGLDHPNIARLIDAGELPDNRPYLAMEYVDGVPVTAYCDAHRLGLRARLTLFLDVCDAVAYAHRRLVLHRDLKPNNILADTDGRVRLLDFGIAKSLEGAAQTRETTLGGSFFSLRAAAPEQVLGDATGVATDVYGLGCLLYELLAGALPFDFAGRPREDIVRLIVEQPPALASVAALANAQADAVAAQRQLADGRALAAALRGDLDTILAKALRKDPAERYRSVDDLAADLRNVVDFRPIAARASERWYRTRMLLRRHRVTAAVAGVLGIAVIATTALSVAQSLRAAAERDRAVAALANAQLQRDHAQRVTDFLVNAFRATNPMTGNSTELRASELLDRAAKTLEQDSARLDPALHATIAQTLSHIFYLLERAPDTVRQAAVARAQVAKITDAPLALRARQQLADAEAAYSEHRYAEADAAARIGLELIGDPQAFEDGFLLAQLWQVRLRATIGTGDNMQAVRIADAALPVLQARPEALFALTDWIRQRRAATISTMGDFAGALPPLQQLEAEQRAGGRTGDAGYIETQRMLAQTLVRVDRHAEAIAIYEDALRRLDALYGEETARHMNMTLGLARAYSAAGRKYEATEFFRRSVVMAHKFFGEVSLFVSTAYLYMGEHYYNSFRDGELAEYALRKAIAAEPPQARGNKLYQYRRLGELLIVRGKLFEAAYILDEAARFVDPRQPGDLPMKLSVNRAYLQLRRYELSEAARTFDAASAAHLDSLDAKDPYYDAIRAQGAELFAYLGRPRAMTPPTVP